MNSLASQKIDTPLGPLVALSDDNALHLLLFTTTDDFTKIIGGYGPTLFQTRAPIESIKKELDLYFLKKLSSFTTPLVFTGTPFQQEVWQTLLKMPFGTTSSYEAVATAIGRPKSSRAVGNAIGLNPFAIIVPCHRILRKNKELGGYNGGVEKKKWLLEHEYCSNKPSLFWQW